MARTAKAAKDSISEELAGSVALERVGGEEGEEPGAALVEPSVRSKFADAAFWAGSLLADEEGVAEVEFSMPENLTSWKIRAWAMGPGTRVGQGEAEAVTAKNLILRLQAPRFFVETDEVVLSANVHNYLPSAKSAKVLLELEGGALEAIDGAARTISLDAGGEARVDWLVRAAREGEAVVRMKALTDEESDAMEMRFPVKVHGISKMVAATGSLRPEVESGSIEFSVPAERRVNESRLEIRYSPTLAGALVDALPYLVDYPYGCTEQTLSRFLPTVMVQKILLDMGLDLASIREKRSNLNPQEIGDDRERAAQWQRYQRNPVFDEAEVRAMAKAGLERLYAMQLSDGGWGWFSGWGENSSPHTTAYVVHGLQIAKENGLALVPGVLENGVEWLKRYQAEQVRRLKNAPTRTAPWKPYADHLDAFVFFVLADADALDVEMREFLYRDRHSLSVYAKAMFGMALHKQGQKEMLAMILENIRQFLVVDEENQTAYLHLGNEGYWWYWYGSEIEAHAYYLKLLVRTDPKGETAPRLVKYLLNNRRHASYWNSTRDTALAIEALAEFWRASGEDKPDMAVEILVNGRKHKEVRIDRENLFSFDNRLVLLGDAVETGPLAVELRKKGLGPLYWNAYLSYFSLEGFIAKAGLEIKVERKVYRLKEKKEAEVQFSGSRGQVVGQQVEKYEREPVANLGTLKSGDLLEIELEIESKNDYEYLVFEDMKAAGFEPAEVRSGYGGKGLPAYMELRDDRVSLFVRWLARGKHSVAYRMRAEIPGKFSALPTLAHAMYAPELRANSDEIKISIVD